MEISSFRKFVEEIEDPFESYVVKFLYLTGARHNEACSKGSPSYSKLRPRKVRKDGSMPKLNPRTRVMGPLKSDVSFDTYESIQVLKIRMVVLKRKSKKTFLRTVALPLDSKFESWSFDLQTYFGKLANDQPLIPLHSKTVNDILNRRRIYEIARRLVRSERIDNPLRHIRYNHVVDFYGFNPWQAPLFFGHKLETAMSGSGGPADAYASLGWRMYFPALLKELPKSNSLPLSSQLPSPSSELSALN